MLAQVRSQIQAHEDVLARHVLSPSDTLIVTGQVTILRALEALWLARYGDA